MKEKSYILSGLGILINLCGFAAGLLILFMGGACAFPSLSGPNANINPFFYLAIGTIVAGLFICYYTGRKIWSLVSDLFAP